MCMGCHYSSRGLYTIPIIYILNCFSQLSSTPIPIFFRLEGGGSLILKVPNVPFDLFCEGNSRVCSSMGVDDPSPRSSFLLPLRSTLLGCSTRKCSSSLPWLFRYWKSPTLKFPNPPCLEIFVCSSRACWVAPMSLLQSSKATLSSSNSPKLETCKSSLVLYALNAPIVGPAAPLLAPKLSEVEEYRLVIVYVGVPSLIFVSVRNQCPKASSLPTFGAQSHWFPSSSPPNHHLPYYYPNPSIYFQTSIVPHHFSLIPQLLMNSSCPTCFSTLKIHSTKPLQKNSHTRRNRASHLCSLC